MNKYRKQYENALQQGFIGNLDDSCLTEFGTGVLLITEARADAKEWMTKYQIELEDCKKAEAALKQLQYDFELVSVAKRKQERKAATLAQVIATLIDQGDFI